MSHRLSDPLWRLRCPDPDERDKDKSGATLGVSNPNRERSKGFPSVTHQDRAETARIVGQSSLKSDYTPMSQA